MESNNKNTSNEMCWHLMITRWYHYKNSFKIFKWWNEKNWRSTKDNLEKNDGKKTWTSWIGTQQPKSPKIENIGKNARKISFLTKNLPDSLKVKTTQLC